MLCCCLFSAMIHAQDTIKLKKYVGNLKKVEVKINNKPFDFLFDTGGGETFISPQLASVMGKQVYGSATGYRMNGEQIKYRKCDAVSITIGNIALSHSTVGVWDLMAILPKELPPLYGVLSLKSFSNKIITLDLASDLLIIETAASYAKKIKKAGLLESRFANGLDGNEWSIFLQTKKQGRAYWLLFDSGNLNDLLLSHNTAREWGLEVDTSGRRQEWNAAPFLFGGKTYEVKIASENILYDGALNYAFLSRFIFFINSPGRTVRYTARKNL